LASQCDVSDFTFVPIRLFESHPTDRIIVLRPRTGTKITNTIKKKRALHYGRSSKAKAPMWASYLLGILLKLWLWN
jgi:hypothetical protein